VASRTPLIAAALRGNLACVRCLVELGAEVGAANIYGNTALILIVDNGHYPTTQYLLEEAGANLDNVNNNEKNVWDLSIEYLKEI
jgi:ankyrin repeat protein